MRLTVSLHQEKTELPIKMQSECHTVGTTNYEKLRNLPTLDGETIIGNVREKDPTVPDWAKRPTKPSYNAQDIGAVAEADMQPLTAADLEEMWQSFN